MCGAEPLACTCDAVPLHCHEASSPHATLPPPTSQHSSPPFPGHTTLPPQLGFWYVDDEGGHEGRAPFTCHTDSGGLPRCRPVRWRQPGIEEAFLRCTRHRLALTYQQPQPLLPEGEQPHQQLSIDLEEEDEGYVYAPWPAEQQTQHERQRAQHGQQAEQAERVQPQQRAAQSKRRRGV